MNPDVGGPFWIFQLWLRSYFPKTSADSPKFGVSPTLGRQLLDMPISNMLVEDYFVFFYTCRGLEDFSVCHSRGYPACLKYNMAEAWESSEPTWGEDIQQIWGSFLISRDLHYGLTTAKGRLGVEVYLPNLLARQFGFIQSCPVLYPESKNILSSWRKSFNSKTMSKEISKLYHQLFQQFEMKTFQPSSRPTTTFKIWWSSYSKKFFEADLNLAKSQVLKGVADGNRRMVDKRTRPNQHTDLDQTEISDQEQGPSFVNSLVKSSSIPKRSASSSKRSKISDQVSSSYVASSKDTGNSHRTVEISINNVRMGDVDENIVCIESSGQSIFKDNEVHQASEHEGSSEPVSNSFAELYSKLSLPQCDATNTNAIPPAPLLSPDMLVLLDELKDQIPKLVKVDNEETKAAADLVNNLGCTDLLGIVNDNLYDRFKEALTVLIAANHFSPEKVREIEDHLVTMDVSVSSYVNALKKWDAGRPLEQKYGDIVRSQSPRAAQLLAMHESYNKDAQELTELRARAHLVQKRMAATSVTMKRELAEHRHELQTYSVHGKETNKFLAVKDSLEQTMIKTSADWAAWKKILF